MAEIVLEVFGRVVVELVAAGISGAIQSAASQRRSRTKTTASSQKNKLPTTNLLPVQHPRAVLVVSSNITFGNDCERLVNIAFHTSQTFPKIMDTYADIIRYIRQELTKHYPEEHFHIMIGENNRLGFAVDDSQHYAEIKQDRYTVLIFSTKVNTQTKLDTHDANSQMSLIWTKN